MGWAELSTTDSDHRNVCALVIPNLRSLSNFGKVQTDFKAQNEDISNDSAAYITAFTYIEDEVNLQIDCGLNHKSAGLKAFFYVATVTDQDEMQLVCPEDDASDGRCDLHYFRFKDLNVGQSYTVRLETVGERPGRLRCVVGDESNDFILTAQDLNIDASVLAQLEFDRHIEAEFSMDSTAVFAIDNVMESRFD